MAEAVTNTEVESVLASIRRLVRAGRIVPPKAPDKTRETSALLLTQAHRIDTQNVYKLRPELAVPRQQIALEQVQSNEVEPPVKTSKNSRHSSQDVRDLIAKITALETVIADTMDQWEPDDTGASSYAGTHAPALVWQDSVKLDGKGSPIVDEDTSLADGSTDQHVDDLVVDEDMLRLLVAEVVRAELQGDMGVRISRNIRKLIRQEVRRALATEDLT